MPKKVTLERFIELSNIVHNNKYDYKLVKVFDKVKDKVEIICPIHGTFLQDVYSHKKGHGCPDCGNKTTGIKKTHNNKKFIEDSIKVHGDLYDYSKVEYKNNTTKVIITCKIHGDFLQTPDKHKQNRGCPECANEKKGWSKKSWKRLIKDDEIAKFYILRCYNYKENFIKIGRTKNTIHRRFGTQKEMPYKIEIVKTISDSNSDIIFDLEIKFKQKFLNFRYKPEIAFPGDTECYKIEVLDYNMLD